MSKTIVNIITEDNPIPAYLFIKEMYEVGDSLMYISAKDTEDDLDLLAEIDGVSLDVIEEILLKNDMDEYSYEKICRSVKSHLKSDVSYCVNLAGGTSYMVLAVQQVFEDFNSEFFYTDVENNIIIKSKFDDNIYNGDDYHFPIKYRMSLSEYLNAHQIQHNLGKYPHDPTRSLEDADNMFQIVSQQLMTQRDYYILENLRNNYRGNKRGVTFDELKNPKSDDADPILDIDKFVRRLSFTPSKNEAFTKADIDYLTGGWFEEYVYYLVKQMLEPQEIAINLTIHCENVKRQNELDVLFMKGNKLYVIECKTGVENNSMFNQIVYKACALKESLLGVNCASYIFMLKRDSKDDLERVAQNMGINLVDYYQLIDSVSLVQLMERIKKESKD